MTSASSLSDSSDADAIRRRIWAELQLACTDRSHAWRTPVLATLGLDGMPQARTLVLREVREKHQQLYFYTDRRSPKAAELLHQPAAALVFWSRDLNWQVRLRARLRVEVDGESVAAAWEQVRQSGSSADYLTSHAPGAVLSRTNRDALEVHQLALLIAHIESIDWLELEPGGHRRARMTDSTMQWLVP